jgi:hypothetical protein
MYCPTKGSALRKINEVSKKKKKKKDAEQYVAILEGGLLLNMEKSRIPADDGIF